MATPGKIASWLDNTVRTVNQTAKLFFGPGGALDMKADPGRKNADGQVVGWKGKDYWTGVEGAASDLDNPIWGIIKLPEKFKDTSAAAQQYRAQIMELMYMAARLAEPSNRGLSDNDIIAAATKLAVDSNNPMVIMRRFSEMMGDSAANLENKLGVYERVVTAAINPQTGNNYTVEDFESFIGGSSLPKYRKDLATFYDDRDVDIDDFTGRATFRSTIDSDVQPGEGLGEGGTNEEESDEDFLENF